MDEIAGKGLYFDTPLLTYRVGEDLDREILLEVLPSDRDAYISGLQQVIRYAKDGHTYLLNFTGSHPVRCSASLSEIFDSSRALFRIFLEGHFVCFSPERFISIAEDRVHTYPMKGTIDAELEGAEDLLMNDIKEITEHNTIVDLLRNDLSMIADNVSVLRYRYLTEIRSPQKHILQASTHISAELSTDWHDHIGTMMSQLLPAGSISGAPKKRTLEIIEELENYDRGFYTGVAIFYDGTSLDSAVMIRFLESTHTSHLYQYKSGGGITALSDVEKEYEETLNKIYVPIF